MCDVHEQKSSTIQLTCNIQYFYASCVFIVVCWILSNTLECSVSLGITPNTCSEPKIKECNDLLGMKTSGYFLMRLRGLFGYYLEWAD